MPLIPLPRPLTVLSGSEMGSSGAILLMPRTLRSPGIRMMVEQLNSRSITAAYDSDQSVVTLVSRGGPALGVANRLWNKLGQHSVPVVSLMELTKK